jgi:diguanylate cyclase (GGDEF)-like protein
MQEQTVRVSLSIGISFFPEQGKCGEVLIKHADRTMYQAKRLGGNCYCIYE